MSNVYWKQNMTRRKAPWKPDMTSFQTTENRISNMAKLYWTKHQYKRQLHITGLRMFLLSKVRCTWDRCLTIVSFSSFPFTNCRVFSSAYKNRIRHRKCKIINSYLRILINKGHISLHDKMQYIVLYFIWFFF